ncbi:MAG: PQQ-binding-like beta-propeller repeat protein [Planctomycetaceae bacterium]
MILRTITPPGRCRKTAVRWVGPRAAGHRMQLPLLLAGLVLTLAPALSSAQNPLIIQNLQVFAEDNDQQSNEGQGRLPQANSSKELSKALARGKEAIQKADYSQAIEILQERILDPRANARDDQIHDESEDYFVDQNMSQSLKREVQQLIGSLPPEGRRLYELRYGIAARQLLDEASKLRDPQVLEEVARRFFHTNAGYEATYLLGTYYLDRSQPLAAAMHLEQLRGLGERSRNWEPMLSLMTAIAWARAGLPESASRTLQDLKKNHPDHRLTLGGKSIALFDREEDSLNWLESVAGIQGGPALLAASDWTMFRGRSSRNAAGPQAAPPIIEQWKTSTLRASEEDDPRTLDAAEAAFKQLGSEARRDNFPTIPAVNPLVAGDRLVIRTLQNVRAVDRKSGALLWECAVNDLSDSSAMLNQLVQQLPVEQAPPVDGPRQPSAAKAYLQERAWFDLSSGTLSSNEEFVFAVEELPFNAVYDQNRDPRFLQPALDPAPVNKIMAFELATGKLAWEVGGPVTANPLPMAGSYFLGPPLPLGDDLYCLVENGAEILLVSLEARSGRRKWTQSLILPEFGVQLDEGRRTAGLSPSFADGILICPTSAGAIIAVDPARHQLLWGYRYSSPANGMRSAAFVRGRVVILGGPFPVNPNDVGSKFDRWFDSVPILAEGRVLLTPNDSSELHCLDQLDGSLVWKVPRDQGLYVAAIEAAKVIVVGRNRIDALRLADGTPAWKQPITIPPPSGRGYRSGHLYCLPLSTGQIATIDLRDGRVLARSTLPSGQALGNLVVAGDAVISQTFDTLTQFRGLAELEKQTGDRLSTAPADADALALRGEMQLHLGHEDAGVADLRKSHESRSNPRTRALIADVLMEGLRLDFKKYRQASADLHQIIDDRALKVRYLKLFAAGLRNSGEHDTAFGTYMKLAALDENEARLEQWDESLAIRMDLWAHNRMTETYLAASAQQRAAIDPLIRAELDRVIDGGDVDRLRGFIRVYGALPLADAARRALIDRLSPVRDSLELENHLRSLRESPDESVAANATARLAALYIDRNSAGPARTLVDELLERFADVPCLEGKTGRQLVDEWSADTRIAAAMAAASTIDNQWPERHFSVKRTERNAHVPQEIAIPIVGPADPRYEDWFLSLEPSEIILKARDSSGRERWRLPIANAVRTLGGNYRGYYAFVHGHRLVVVLASHFFVLNMLVDTRAPEILWSRELAPEIDPNQSPEQALRLRNRRINGMLTDSRGRTLRSVGPVTDEYICYRSGTMLRACDPLTGDVVWERNEITPDSMVFGDDEHIFVLPVGAIEAAVFQSRDGERLPSRPIPAIDSWVLVDGRHIVFRNVGVDPVRNQLCCVDALTGKTVWQTDISPAARIAELAEGAISDEVAVFDPAGRFVVYGVRDGAPRIDSSVAPIERLQRITVLRLADRYVLFTLSDPRKVRLLSGGGWSWTVNGPAYSFDRRTGALEWSTMIENQGVNLDQFLGSPVLLLAARVIGRGSQSEPDDGTSYALSLLDMRNGRIIYRTRSFEPLYPFATKVDPIGQRVEFDFKRVLLEVTLNDVPLSQPLETQTDSAVPRAAPEQSRPAAKARKASLPEK